MLMRFILKKIEQFYGLKMVHFILVDLKRVKENQGRVMNTSQKIINMLDILDMEKKMEMDFWKPSTESNTMENGLITLDTEEENRLMNMVMNIMDHGKTINIMEEANLLKAMDKHLKANLLTEWKMGMEFGQTIAEMCTRVIS